MEMIPEPLKGKNCEICRAFHFNDVAAAVEFYRKYRHNPQLFQEDFPEEYKKFDGNLGWETWCLDYSFEDVVEREEAGRKCA